MRGLIVVCLGMLMVRPVLAADSVEKIEACMRANIPASLQIKEFEIAATDTTGGTRTLVGRLHGRMHDDRLNAMMRIEAPSDMRGAAYLMREADGPDKEEEMYVYLPALRKVRRVTGGMRDNSLFGTDLSYADVKQIGFAFTGRQLKLEKSDTFEDRPMWLLSTAPDPSVEYRYDKVLAWIDQKSCMLLKAEFMQGGVVRKRFDSSARFLAQSGPHWYITEGRIEDLQEKTSTRLRITGVLTDKDLANRLFSPQTFYVGGP